MAHLWDVMLWTFTPASKPGTRNKPSEDPAGRVGQYSVSEIFQADCGVVGVLLQRIGAYLSSPVSLFILTPKIRKVHCDYHYSSNFGCVVSNRNVTSCCVSPKVDSTFRHIGFFGGAFFGCFFFWRSEYEKLFPYLIYTSLYDLSPISIWWSAFTPPSILAVQNSKHFFFPTRLDNTALWA